MLNLRSIKTQMIIYLACLAVFLSVKDKDAMFLLATVLAVVSTAGAESVIRYLRTKTFQITESSVITGLIIGYVLSSDEPWFKFVFAAWLAVLSKNFIQFQKKHLFNPAAFGIFLTIILLGAYTQWKGTYLWYILGPFGFYLAYKIRRVELIAGYLVTFFVLFGIQAVMKHVPLLHVVGYASYFYIFIMTIDPRTTPLKPLGKYMFGVGMAILVFIMTQMGLRFDVELLSLLAMNAAVPLFNKLEFKKGGPA
jgi:Na+-translocating ferredoxin:NAD+ oxidoreductase RnfD subunit